MPRTHFKPKEVDQIVKIAFTYAEAELKKRGFKDFTNPKIATVLHTLGRLLVETFVYRLEGVNPETGMKLALKGIFYRWGTDNEKNATALIATIKQRYFNPEDANGIPEKLKYQTEKIGGRVSDAKILEWFNDNDSSLSIIDFALQNQNLPKRLYGNQVSVPTSQNKKGISK